MKRMFLALAAMTLVAVAPIGAETWTGTITDSMCGVKHSAEKHAGKAADHAACVKKCIDGGGSYVFVAANKLHQIANQDFAALKTHAGQQVVLTGEMKNDKIVISKIETPKEEKKEEKK
jgi:hypothetical protein